MEGDDPLVHSMENLIVDKKPTEYEDPAIVRFVTKTNPIHSQNLNFSLQKTSLKPQPPGFYASAPESNRIPQDIWGAPTPPAPAAPIQPPPGFGGKINRFFARSDSRIVDFSPSWIWFCYFSTGTRRWIEILIID